MKQLFEYTDNVPLMKDFIFPCLNERICDFHNKSDMEALRCVCKKLNEILPVRISSKCKKYKGKCTTHCKAYPFYKHLDNRYKKHIISLDVHIHFTKKALADMFRDRYYTKIKRKKYGGGLSTCCNGKGFIMHMSEEKRQLIRDQAYEYPRGNFL